MKLKVAVIIVLLGFMGTQLTRASDTKKIPVYVNLSDGATITYKDITYRRSKESQLIPVETKIEGGRIEFSVPGVDAKVSMGANNLKSITISKSKTGLFVIGNYEGSVHPLYCCVTDNICQLSACGDQGACVSCPQSSTCCSTK